MLWIVLGILWYNMVPNVKMAWASKVTKCEYCDQNILTATPVIIVAFWNRNAAGKKWSTKNYYHPICWIQHGLDYLRMNPYTAPKVVVSLTDEQKVKRYSILRKHASLMQRKRNLSTTNPNYELMLARIEASIAELIISILEVGGVPEKWAKH